MYVGANIIKKIISNKKNTYICNMQEYSYLSDELDGFVEEEESHYESLTCFFDGACYPNNPDGNMGWGFHIGKETAMCGFEKNKKGNTNNVAEYLALYNLLNHLCDYSGESILIKGDSKLVINQMNGSWRIKEGSYVWIAHKTKERLQYVRKNNKVKLEWIPRENNVIADKLSTLINKI